MLQTRHVEAAEDGAGDGDVECAVCGDNGVAEAKVSGQCKP